MTQMAPTGAEADDALGLLAGLFQVAELAQAAGRLAGQRALIESRPASCAIHPAISVRAAAAVNSAGLLAPASVAKSQGAMSAWRYLTTLAYK
jgi:hypothetical protein